MKITGNNSTFLNLAKFETNGKVVKEDDRYIVKDNTTLKSLVLSSTNLKPKKETSGHNHDGQEEVYFFISGQGDMQLDDDKFSVNPGDIVLVKDDVFHKVYNPSDEEELYFICVLQGARHN
ncbi:MAG: cupin [Gammaproteobacteria bacterium]|nr:cupin [Gammaproteobacteria bacterium]|tara:strand:- start:10972 stop:11334 length:363 start_codon:yes stop_codon:yes gene_type:complete